LIIDPSFRPTLKIPRWNKVNRFNRPNLHEVRTGQEAKEEGLDRPVQGDQAAPQMRPRQQLSKAGLKEPTISSVASKQRVPSTMVALMEAFTVDKHTTERLVGTPTKTTRTVFSSQRTGVQVLF
jgi:hypothetical protein